MYAWRRWGATALDEAGRSRSQLVLDYLKTKCSPAAVQVYKLRYQHSRAQMMLEACSAGHIAAIQDLLEKECSPDMADYDARTGLMLAAAKGQLEVAQLLLGAGANPRLRDNFGHTAM